MLSQTRLTAARLATYPRVSKYTVTGLAYRTGYGPRGYSGDSLNQFGGQSPTPSRRSAVFSTMRSLPTNTVVNFVPQQEAWVIERMGRVLEPGLQILVPFIDSIKYVQSLKENAIEIPSQSAITSDNVSLDINGVLYIRVIDAYKASYGVEDAGVAISQLAQTTMRSEIGRLTLDSVLKERQNLNQNISEAINQAAEAWGVQCLRYEIKDVHPPSNVLAAMHQQVSAERQKRAEILESEGQRQSAINIAEGKKQSTILASEAFKAEKINQAAGDAEAIKLRAAATARGLQSVAEALLAENGEKAVSYQVAERYVDAFSKMAKESNTMIVPAGLGDMSGMIAQALGIYKNIEQKNSASGQKLSVTSHTPAPAPAEPKTD